MINEEGLRDWFGKSKSKDGKKGWVNVVTGGTCASDEPGEGTPKCVSSAKRASMTKAERLSAQRRKKKADPGQQQKSGAAKPTYVSTDSKKKMKKEEIELLDEMPYQVVGSPDGKKEKKIGKPIKSRKYADAKAAELADTHRKTGGKYRSQYVEDVEVTEAKDKKGKGSGSKDACYHKVKSRYSVWPSAYASGALVKCRKVGAANWGNKSEEVETIGLGEGKIADRLRQMNKDAKKRWDTEGEKAKKDAYKALDTVKSNQSRMERGMKEGTEFSNWRDDFKATEYEFTDIIKPEPIKGGVIEEGSFKIDPKAHRQSQREKKIRDRTKTGDEGSSIAKTKTKGPDLMGEGQIEEGQKCWKGYEKKGTKKMFGKTYNNCVKKEENEIDEMISTTGIRVPDQEKVKARKTKPEKKKLPKGYVKFFDKKGKGRIIDGKKVYEEGYAPGDVDQKVGAVTAIPKKDQDAAKARLLAKAKAKREKMKKENEIDEAKHTPTKSDLESKIGGGNLKKLSKKASTRIDYDVDGDVDPQDKVEKSKGDYGEELPTPFGKFRTGDSKKVKVKKESLANWRNEIEEGAAWTKKSGKSESGGLNEKGRKSYERENPGSDLKAPSKKVGNPRRKSFCARMKGMKKKLTSSKTANDPDSRINKSLRAWNC